MEAILVLGSGGAVRSVDIAEHLGYSKPSVCRAVAQLAKVGLVVMEDDKTVRLTPDGKAQAEAVYEKHVFFRSILLQAGVQEPAASEEACKIEHAVSDESFAAIKAAYGDATPRK